MDLASHLTKIVAWYKMPTEEINTQKIIDQKVRNTEGEAHYKEIHSLSRFC